MCWGEELVREKRGGRLGGGGGGDGEMEKNDGDERVNKGGEEKELRGMRRKRAS
jgi:hypothetical protein